MYKTILLGFALLASLITTAQQKNIFTSTTVPYQELKSGFANPPSEARLRCYWWWLNSMATKESITRDLEEMKDKGYGGASIFDAGSSSYQAAAKTAAGPVFMSPEWMELYKHTVREADRIGIELSVNVQSGWNPGGPTITPEFALKKITWSETDITGGSEIKIKLPKPVSTLIYRDIFVQAVKRPSEKNPLKNDVIKYWDIKSFNKNMGAGGNFPFQQLSDNYPETSPYYAINKDEIIDLTGNFKDSILQWKAPEGNWTIIRYGWTCTGVKTSTTSDGWNGLSLDHLSPEAFELFSKDVILPLIRVC